MITWSDLVLPPINLWTLPSQPNLRRKEMLEDTNKEKEYMDTIVKVLDTQGVELWEFIEALQNIEDVYLEQSEDYPDSEPPKIRVWKKEDTGDLLISVTQKLYNELKEKRDA